MRTVEVPRPRLNRCALAIWLPAIDPSGPNAAAKQPSVINLRNAEFDTFILKTPISEPIMSVVGSVSVHNARSSINPAME